MSSLREECGVFGIFAGSRQDLAHTVYYGLFALQHRGQESCGIAVNDDGIFSSYKDLGLVSDVFTARPLQDLGEGNIAVGHVRYGTTGSNERINSQPIVINHHKGRMALCHNGNIVNSGELRRSLELEGSIFHTTSDTEVIAYMITKKRIRSDSIEEAVDQAMDQIKGAYSLVLMSPSKLIAVRDPNGFRPLCYGRRSDGAHVVASETCALDAVGAEYVRDIEPGEIMIFDKDGVRSIMDHAGRAPRRICIFEYIYFSRPDSVINGVGVHEARRRAGACLALEHPVQADVVIGVPDSGLDAAMGYAEQSGIPYGIGFIKNKYIGRTFIAPGQKNREDLVMIKLNVLKKTVRGKRIVLVDDSIVRGTTIARIIKRLREEGAAEIHVMSAAPPFRDPCFYGTDISNRDDLIACRYGIDEIAGVVGADSVGYLNPDHLGMLIGAAKGEGYCDACFTGRYPTEKPGDMDKSKFERKISEGN